MGKGLNCRDEFVSLRVLGRVYTSTYAAKPLSLWGGKHTPAQRQFCQHRHLCSRVMSTGERALLPTQLPPPSPVDITGLHQRSERLRCDNAAL